MPGIKVTSSVVVINAVDNLTMLTQTVSNTSVTTNFTCWMTASASIQIVITDCTHDIYTYALCTHTNKSQSILPYPTVCPRIKYINSLLIFAVCQHILCLAFASHTDYNHDMICFSLLHVENTGPALSVQDGLVKYVFHTNIHRDGCHCYMCCVTSVGNLVECKLVL